MNLSDSEEWWTLLKFIKQLPRNIAGKTDKFLTSCSHYLPHDEQASYILRRPLVNNAWKHNTGIIFFCSIIMEGEVL